MCTEFFAVFYFVGLIEANIYKKASLKIEDVLNTISGKSTDLRSRLRIFELLCKLRKTIPRSLSVFNGVEEFLVNDDIMAKLNALEIIHEVDKYR